MSWRCWRSWSRGGAGGAGGAGAPRTPRRRAPHKIQRKSSRAEIPWRKSRSSLRSRTSASRDGARQEGRPPLGGEAGGPPGDQVRVHDHLAERERAAGADGVVRDDPAVCARAEDCGDGGGGRAGGARAGGQARVAGRVALVRRDALRVQIADRGQVLLGQAVPDLAARRAAGGLRHEQEGDARGGVRRRQRRRLCDVRGADRQGGVDAGARRPRRRRDGALHDRRALRQALGRRRRRRRRRVDLFCDDRVLGGAQRLLGRLGAPRPRAEPRRLRRRIERPPARGAGHRRRRARAGRGARRRKPVRQAAAARRRRRRRQPVRRRRRAAPGPSRRTRRRARRRRAGRRRRPPPPRPPRPTRSRRRHRRRRRTGIGRCR